MDANIFNVEGNGIIFILVLNFMALNNQNKK